MNLPSDMTARRTPATPTTTSESEPVAADEKAVELLLHEHRKSIDRLDAILVYTLGERFKHTMAVGKLKVECDLAPADPKREAQQIERLQKLARKADVDPEFAKRFITFIIEEVIRHHRLQRHSKEQKNKE